MKRLLFLLPLFLTSSAWGVPCNTIDVTPYTQDQINLIPALAYEIGSANGATEVPSVAQSGTSVTVCFKNAPFDTATVITAASLIAQYQTDQSARTKAAAQIQAWQTELSTTTTAVINGYNNFGSLTQAQINQGTRNIVRIFWLRQLLGIDAQ